MLYSSYKSTKKCIYWFKEKGDFENYFKIIALQASLFTYVVAMTFMNRLRAEILYWLILYTACAYNIYVIKSSDSAVRNDNDNENSVSLPNDP